MSAKLCSTVQILGSSVDQEQMVNVINCQSDLEEQDKMEESFKHSNDAEFAAVDSNVTMQMACSDPQNEQECPSSKDQKKIDNEKKKFEGRPKERDLFNRVYTAGIKKEKQPKRNTVSLEDIKMSDFKFSLTFSIHEKGSSSEPNYDTFQQKTRSGIEMDQARLMADFNFGKQQLVNSPAYISAISSSQESTVHQVNNLSKVLLTADHNISSTICDDCNTMANNTVSLLNRDKLIVENKSISKSPVLFTGGRIQSVASYPIVPYTYIEQKDHDVFSIFDDQITPSVIPNRKELIIKSKLWDQRHCEYEEGWEDGSSDSSSSEDDDDNSLAIIFSQEKIVNEIEFVESSMGKIQIEKEELLSFEEGEEEELIMQCRRDAAIKGDLSPMHSKTKKKGRQRDKSWDGRVTEERFIRCPPMRVAKLKQLNQRA